MNSINTRPHCPAESYRLLRQEEKFSVGCFILLAFILIGGGGAFMIAVIASGNASVSLNGLPLGVVGGVVFCLGLFGYLLYQFVPAIGTLMGSSPTEDVKPTNCVVSIQGVILHDKDGNKYILKWKGIRSLAILHDTDDKTYVAFYLSDRRYVVACEHTNSFVSTRYSSQFELILPEPSLPMPAKDFTKLLTQRAQSQGIRLTTQEMSETLNSYSSVSSNSELERLYNEAGKYMLPILGFIFPFLALFLIRVFVFVPVILTFSLILLYFIAIYIFLRKRRKN